MSLFNQTRQRITISGEAQNILEALASEIKARKLKDIKISSVRRIDYQWQYVINCKLAEATYYQEILPLLYDSVETQSLGVLLEFGDESELVKRCPRELLISFSLSSRYAYGDKAEDEFIQEMHRNILQSSRDKSAAVAYYIVSSGAVTMCVPCTDTEAIERIIRNRFDAFKIKEFMIKTVDRKHA